MASVTALLAWGGVPWDELAIAFRVVVLVVMVWPGAAGGPCSTELRLFPEELIADDEPAEAIAYGNIAAVESVPSTRVFFFFRYRRIRISLRDRSSFVEIEIGASKASQLIAELAVRAYASGVRGIGAIHRPRRFYINDIASIAGVTIASFAMVPGARLLVVSGLAAFFVVWTARQWLGIHRAAQRLASGIVPVSVGEWAAALDALAQREQLARSLTVPPHRSSEDPRGLTEERAIADVRTWWETRRVNGGGWRSPELAPSKSILEPVRSSTGVYRTSSVAADNERAATVRDVVHRRAKLTATLLRVPVGGRVLLSWGSVETCTERRFESTMKSSFFDVHHLPPWDFWIGYRVPSGTRSAAGPALHAWIPNDLVAVVEKAVRTQPGVLAWQDDEENEAYTAARGFSE